MNIIDKHRIVWTSGMLGLVAAIVVTIYTGEWWLWILSFVYFRVLRLVAFNIGLHRYLAHRSFQTDRWRHKFFLWSSVLVGQGSPITWVMQHRHHHRHADQELDIHSPYDPKNPWVSLFGLFTIKPINWWTDEKQVKVLPKDLLKDPTAMFIHNHYHLILLILNLVTFWVLGWHLWLLFVLQPVGLSFVHVPLITHLAHLPLYGSYRNYDTTDKSYNNKWLNWYAPEEAFHNNHHAVPNNYRFGHKPDEIDPTAWVVEKFFIKQ